jgi:hypothetical protein
VAVELHGDDVVLARELWWHGRAWSELPTVNRRRRRSSRQLELWKTKLGCERMKLIGLESTNGSRCCSSSFGLGFRRSEGGWRRWTAKAAEVR